MRHDVSHPTTRSGSHHRQGPQLLVGHGHRRLGELDAEGAAEAAAAVGPVPHGRRATVDGLEQGGGLVDDAQLAEHVAALVQRDPHRPVEA